MRSIGAGPSGAGPSGSGAGAHRRQRRALLRAGFTVLEAFIVLAILALTTALGSVAFRHWVLRARTVEAVTMLSRIASQEQAFKAGGGHFIPMRADAYPDRATADEAAGAFYPLSADSPILASAYRRTRVDDPARAPSSWRALGIRPPEEALYCTYLANAGDEGPLPPGLRFGAALLAGAEPGPWFYALGVCNLAAPGGYPDEVTIFGISSSSPEVRVFNQGK
jgi:Tfp pilus assembly protein PilE